MNKLFCVLLISLAGCTTSMKSSINLDNKIKDVDYKNYSIGTEKSAYVGEPIIDRKSYKAVVKKNLYQAQNDFSLSGGISTTSINLNASAGDTFRVAGVNEKNNPVVNIPGSIFMFGITPSGAWDGTVMSPSFWTSPIGSGNQYKLMPSDTTFKAIESTTPISEAGYINHEIIFTGITKDGITLLYREYTFENMARSDYKQDLVYPLNAKEIRFRNYLIEVKSVNASQINYVVKSE